MMLAQRLARGWAARRRAEQKRRERDLDRARRPGGELDLPRLMRERAADLAALLADDNSYFYVCGLKSMEEGVVLALRDVAQLAGLDWDSVGAALQAQGRLHLETY